MCNGSPLLFGSYVVQAGTSLVTSGMRGDVDLKAAAAPLVAPGSWDQAGIRVRENRSKLFPRAPTNQRTIAFLEPVLGLERWSKKRSPSCDITMKPLGTKY